MRKHLWTYCIVFGWLLSSCSIAPVREAQEVVEQADSLWHEGKMYGVDEGDSATLAQAYERLKELSAFSRQKSEYAHACYHYGRLLREKDDPVAAMQAFLDATRSGTKDYHILGRVYSNIGDICHLAGDFQLSYDMFERSADMFLRNGDTLLYYYDLNNMAFELAEQGKKGETETLIDSITQHCNDQSVKVKTLETKALLYQSLKCYDSVITIVDSLQTIGYNDVIELMMKARAFQNLNYPDSALYYANCVVQHSPTSACAIAAYYILSHNSNTLNKDSILILTSARADAQKAWAYSQSGLSQAVQLLEQDLTRKPDRRWIFFITATVFFICTCVILYFILYKHHLLKEQRANYADLRRKDVEISCNALKNSKNIKHDLAWDNYESMSTIVNARLGGLENKLSRYPNITHNDVRLSVLFLLNLSYSEIAEILNLSPKSIAKLKSITSHKLGVPMRDLQSKLFEIICDEDA